LYEPDAVFEPEPGMVLRGRAQIRPALAQLAGLQPSIVSDGAPEVVVVGDIALVSNRWSLTASLPDGGLLHQSGLSADVLRCQPAGCGLVLIDQPRGSNVAL